MTSSSTIRILGAVCMLGGLVFTATGVWEVLLPSVNAEKDFALNPDIQVTSQTPPTFLLQAEDDPVDPVENSLVYYSALRKAGVPAEMHVYVKGGHAFGLRPTESPITRWPELVETWLATIGMISK